MTIGKSSHRSSDPAAVPEPAVPAAPPVAIGRVLSDARRQAGLTVDQVSADTRVRVPILHAIEDEDFSRCGGDVYARGHIRAIAKAVGVDGEALVAAYDAAHGGAPSAQRPAPLPDAGPIRMTDHRRPNWTAAMVAAIFVVVGLIGFNLFSGDRTPATVGEASAPLSATAPASPTASVQPPAPAPSVEAIAAAPADRVTVKLVAEAGTSWVSALDGKGKSLFQNNLEQGGSQTFTDPKQIKLVIGNAGAVHLYVNGKDLGPAGTEGQVKHLTYTPGDPQAG